MEINSVLDGKKVIERFKKSLDIKNVFPFIKNGSSRAFQSISGNMHPLVEENSLVICEEAQPNEIQENEMLVLISRKKGFFLNRIKKN